jgi:hypothetical protein
MFLAFADLAKSGQTLNRPSNAARWRQILFFGARASKTLELSRSLTTNVDRI